MLYIWIQLAFDNCTEYFYFLENMTSDNPILNSPYLEPKLHYDTDSEGSLDYNIVCKGRRIFKPDASVIPMRQRGQKELFEWNEDEQEYGLTL